jgi:hypothetical protein
MAACIGITLLMSIQDTSQPWRLHPFVLLYGLGYDALGPVYAAAMVNRFPGKYLGLVRGG